MTVMAQKKKKRFKKTNNGRGILNGQQAMKGWSNLLEIRAMQIQTLMRCDFSSIRPVKLKCENIKSW